MVRWCAVVRGGLAAALVCALAGATPAFAARSGDHPKLDRELNDRASKKGKGNSNGKTQVIVILKPGWSADDESKKLGGRLGRILNSINGKVVELPNGQLKKLADYPGVDRIVYDRPTGGEMNRVAVTVGARAVQQTYGYRGAGIGVAVIDSGITSWHEDLTYLGIVVAREDEEQPARSRVRRLRQRADVAVRRQRPRHARRGDHRRQRLRLPWRTRRHRTRCAHRQPEGARPARAAASSAT